ncbi:hypothetical protein RhiJN_20336 [Ceratobasidium sp. AG-Ba]|nr:hypothetical protein RhiJN_20336 [Ceratobasidium sp. AG-Ba]
MTVMISTVGQTFYAWRITRLTGWTWLGYLIVASALVQFGAGIGGTVGISIITDFSMFHKFKVAVIVWLVLSAVTDTTITVVLVSYLQTHRTGFPNTDSLINKLIRLTIPSGLVTALCAIADLVTFLCMDNNLHMFFQLILYSQVPRQIIFQYSPVNPECSNRVKKSNPNSPDASQLKSSRRFRREVKVRMPFECSAANEPNATPGCGLTTSCQLLSGSFNYVYQVGANRLTSNNVWQLMCMMRTCSR